jgi:hypothetical protein
MATKENCIVHLKDSLLSQDDIEELMDTAGVLDDVGDAQRAFATKVNDQVELLLEKTVRDTHDAFTAQNLIDKVRGAKNETEALQILTKDALGRNSADTVRRTYRNTLLNKLREYEARFGVEQEYSISKIEAGTKEEEELFTKVREFEDQIDVYSLTPQRIKELVQGKEGLDRTALAVVAHNEFGRRFLNKHGVPVRFHKNYVIKRRYNTQVLEKMGADKFANFLADRLDLEESFGVGATRTEAISKLKHTYKDLMENDRNKQNLFSSDSKGGSKGVEDATRKFVFKDSRSEYQSFNELSGGGLVNQIEENTWGMATTAVKIDRYGYNHRNVDNVLQEFINKNLGKETSNLQKTVNASFRSPRYKQALADFTGENQYMSSGMSTAGTAIKTAISVGKLGNAITTAMLDPLDTMRQNFYVNGEVFGGFVKYASNMKNLMGKLNPQERLMVANQLGVVTNYLSSETGMRVAKGDLSVRADSKMARAVDKYGAKAMNLATLLPMQTAMSKLSSALTGAQVFTDMLGKVKVSDGRIDVGGLNKFEIDTFKEYNLSSRELAVLKEVEPVKTWNDSGSFLSGKDIRDHVLFSDPETMAKKLGVKPEEVQNVALDLATKYEGFVNDFFSRGTPTPELSVKTALLKGSGSEAFNVTMGLLTQFMDTPLMQLHSASELYDKLKRINNAGQGDTAMAQAWDIAKKVGPDALPQLVTHALVGGAAYMAYDAAWSFALGKESQIEKYRNGDSSQKRDILLNVAGRTSVLPFAFELIANQSSDYYNQNALSTFGGPALGITNDLFNAAKSDREGSLVDFAKKQIPNAWFTQAINNHLLE